MPQANYVEVFRWTGSDIFNHKSLRDEVPLPDTAESLRGDRLRTRQILECIKTFYHQFASDYFLINHSSHCFSCNFTEPQVL